MDNPLTGVIIIIVLLILNGLFSAAETAIVASRKSMIRSFSGRGRTGRRRCSSV